MYAHMCVCVKACVCKKINEKRNHKLEKIQKPYRGGFGRNSEGEYGREKSDNYNLKIRINN